eukprot:TRINITY_DN4142_c0_g1_i1.p1 TRINITY_DN4142_c0_g1~~TRINITY_DN4142_c0_g1_i1.p1  ORF type:complete len:196 (+),score=25.11 TRINITY_DN4142_c0_g1_i1:70-657(+)
MGAKNSTETAPPLREADVEELSRHTHYTVREVVQLHRQFIAEAPSGFIPRQDFGVLSDALGVKDSFISKMLFSAFDHNGDGFISFAEFIASMSVMTRGTADEKAGFAFKLYDIGGPGGHPRGYLTKEDLLQIVTSIDGMLGSLVSSKGSPYPTPEHLINHIFNEMDTNRDGRITLEEYTAGAKRDPAIVQGLALF